MMPLLKMKAINIYNKHKYFIKNAKIIIVLVFNMPENHQYPIGIYPGNPREHL